jgi:pimeloyl-ACP methyl ester carboxylesterase
MMERRSTMNIQPLTINVAQSILDDLSERLSRNRWPDEVVGADWDYGTNLDYLKTLVNYWQHHFDWRAQEAMLNHFAQYRADIDGFGIHFLHERGKGPNPLPLVITHGWPSSFFEMLKIIPRLSDPARYGGNPSDSFDVIVPSLPGFGFSDRPGIRGWQLPQTAELWARLMRDGLGYQRYGAAGGDFGSGVTRLLALSHPSSLVGIHLTFLGFPTLIAEPSDLSEAEKRYLGAIQQWMLREGGYAMIQSTKPQTLAYGLNDSPIGLAGWIVEKFRTLSDCDGEVERRFSKDELLTNIMIYWVTETINSSIRTYYENIKLPPQLKEGQRIEVPAGVALFPKEANLPPRQWANRSLHVQRWTQMPRGGHFAALEEPDLLVEDLRAFFRPLRV